MNTPRSLELFFIDGRPDGMLTAEMFNWTGHVLKTPRTQIKAALARPEAGFTGVYVLLGEQDGEARAYIGESEDLGQRLRSHVVNKDWWDEAILITSAADNLHKAHVKYLESRLVEMARTVGSITLENGNTPPRSSLSEAAIANMESFLETLLVVLPAIRIDMFLNKARSKTEEFPEHAATNSTPIFELVKLRQGISATAYIANGEVVVQSGSVGRGQWSPGSAGHSYEKMYNDLIETGILLVAGEQATFSQDYAFSSPSAAGAALNGRPTNGPADWKLKSDGRTYRQWEQDQLNESIL
jgi:uncharacterized protein DUF4357